ncbi:MAG: hypothetical protein ACYS8W_14240 [Planctomycetota bacterium]|jgi:hypothetical protein
MKGFLLGRMELVKYLCEDPKVQVHYVDIALITTAVLSACSARRWAGKGIDKVRFVELLVEHSPEDFHTSWVSVPALLNEGFITNSDTPYGNLGNECRIYKGREIDMPFEDAQKQYPQVSNRNLRECSYASLIYKWLRCGYAHEYWHHDNITHVPPTRGEALVSYIGRTDNGGIRRMVAFHIDYLINLAEYHVSVLPNDPGNHPQAWWINQT